MKYKITADRKQVRIIQRALNFYFRSYLGQLDLFHHDISYDDSRMLEGMLQHLMGLSRGESYGIHSKKIDDEARNACDIHDVIRHQMWKDNPNARDYTVDAYPPMSKGVYELPEIEHED